MPSRLRIQSSLTSKQTIQNKFQAFHKRKLFLGYRLLSKRAKKSAHGIACIGKMDMYNYNNYVDCDCMERWYLIMSMAKFNFMSKLHSGVYPPPV